VAYSAADCLRIRRDFPALDRPPASGPALAYLDGPGGSQVPQCVIDAIADVYTSCNVNTHGNFPPSQEVDRRMEAARRAVAAFLGAAHESCISFGQNMTTLNFSLANAIVKTLQPGDEILITQLDHEANRGPWLNLRDRGVSVQEVRMFDSGVLDAADMAAKVTPRTRLMALGAASNALGTVNDIALARRLTREVGALLVIDAVHYAPHFPIDVQAMDVDFLLCSAYKFYGPHVGVLYSRPGALDALPSDRLSTQDPAAPFRIETGTLNHAAIAGVHAAIDYIARLGVGPTLRARLIDAMTSIAHYEHSLARMYYSRVRALPGVRVWGPDFAAVRRAPTVSITLQKHSPDAAANALGKQGICVWNGNFYAARAVELLGLEAGGGLLRTGVSMYTTPQEIERLLAALAALG
jgi:cysteine desulfurase family protein (TIGR01976 family)